MHKSERPAGEEIGSFGDGEEEPKAEATTAEAAGRPGDCRHQPAASRHCKKAGIAENLRRESNGYVCLQTHQ